MASDGGGEWPVHDHSDERTKMIFKTTKHILCDDTSYKEDCFDKDGYMPISLLIEDARLRKFEATEKDVIRIVTNDKTKRFRVSVCRHRIRAARENAPITDISMARTAMFSCTNFPLDTEPSFWHEYSTRKYGFGTMGPESWDNDDCMRLRILTDLK